MTTGKASVQPVSPIIGVNPYVGPRPFEQEESKFFFGREEETKILSGLVVAHQLSLFYAQSGAGKSSLLRAGLLPRLTRKTRIGSGEEAYLYQTMQLLPIVTVGRGVPPSTSAPISNIFSFSAQLALLPSADPNDLALLTLVDALEILLDDGISAGAIWEPAQVREGRVRPPLFKPDTALLIFDQFEEIFTVHPERWREREDFFRQVDAALSRFPTLHILFTMREDYLAALTPYANLLTDELRHRFRMERLRKAGALAAVVQPALAGEPSRVYAPGVAEALVDNLRRIQRSQRSQLLARVKETGADDAVEHADDQGEYVEPVHLQIVCRDLWTGLSAERTAIQESDLQSFGDVDQALTNFYESTLANVVAATSVSERALRRWFNEELITPARTKGLVYRDEAQGETVGLPNDAVDILQRAWIIRSDIRGGDAWYELAHDRLVEPIRAANHQWAANYENPVATAYARWEVDKHPALLLRGERLFAAETYKRQHPHELFTEEVDFLNASRRQWDQEQTAAQQRRRRIVLGATAAALIVVLTIFGILQVARGKQAEADRDLQEKIAQSRQLANLSGNLLDEGNSNGALRLGIDAGTVHSTVEAFSAIRNALAPPVSLVQQFTHGANVEAIAWHKDEDAGVEQIVSVGGDGDRRIVRWDLMEGRAIGEWTIPAELGNATSVAWNKAGTQVATGHLSGELVIWSLNGTYMTRTADTWVNTIDWQPKRNLIATGGADGIVRIWEPERMEPMQEFAIGAWINRVRWDTNGKRILIAGMDGAVRVWNWEDAQEQFSIGAYAPFMGATDIQWNKSDEQVVSAGVVGSTPAGLQTAAYLWQLGTVTQFPLQTFGGYSRSIQHVAPSPRGTWVATGGEGDAVDIWKSEDGSRSHTLPGHVAGVRDLVWLADNRLLTADGSGQIFIWSFALNGELPLRADYTGSVSVLQWPNDQQIEWWDNGLILSASQDGSGHLWRAESGEILLQLEHAGSIRSVRLHPTLPLLLTTSADGTVGVWDLAPEHRQKITQLGPGSGSYSFARWDHSFIMAGFECVKAPACPEHPRYELHLWRAERVQPGVSPNPEQDLNLAGHTDLISTARWNPNDLVAPSGTRMVTASWDGTIRIWDVDLDSPTVGESLQTLTHTVPLTATVGVTNSAEKVGGDFVRVQEAKWNDTGSMLLSYSNDGTARLWQWDGQAQQFVGTKILRHSSAVSWADWFDDERKIVTVGSDGRGNIWDAQSGELLYSLEGHTGAINGTYWVNGTKQLLTISDDATAILWEIADGTPKRWFIGHSDAILGALIDESKDLLLTYGKDNTARLWKLSDAEDTGALSNAEEIAVLTGHTDDVIVAGWNADHTRIVTGGLDGVVRQYYREMDDLLRVACQKVVVTASITEAGGAATPGGATNSLPPSCVGIKDNPTK